MDHLRQFSRNHLSNWYRLFWAKNSTCRNRVHQTQTAFDSCYGSDHFRGVTVPCFFKATARSGCRCHHSGRVESPSHCKQRNRVHMNFTPRIWSTVPQQQFARYRDLMTYDQMLTSDSHAGLSMYANRQSHAFNNMGLSSCWYWRGSPECVTLPVTLKSCAGEAIVEGHNNYEDPKNHQCSLEDGLDRLCQYLDIYADYESHWWFTKRRVQK